MDGIERLKRLSEGQEDPSLLRVIEYLSSLEDMDEMFLNVDKSLKDMVDYIKGEAKKLSKDGYCWVEDGTVYQWAVDYWSKSDDELGIKKITPKPKVEVKKDEIVPDVQKVGQLTLF